jgi:hypothetical protein
MHRRFVLDVIYDNSNPNNVPKLFCHVYICTLTKGSKFGKWNSFARVRRKKKRRTIHLNLVKGNLIPRQGRKGSEKSVIVRSNPLKPTEEKRTIIGANLSSRPQLRWSPAAAHKRTDLAETAAKRKKLSGTPQEKLKLLARLLGTRTTSTPRPAAALRPAAAAPPSGPASRAPPAAGSR